MYPMVFICVETNWPGDWFEMAVLVRRSIFLVIIIIITKEVDKFVSDAIKEKRKLNLLSKKELK